ncbi:exonuclease domain-containing protein [Corynebacterium halotolerans]|uniref:DNA polymerase III epsilon subunit n=1 Tax=Corynebacterium halotolerans YIM 70093 = DSM 44683 TaxID=1121362 RepID=M1NTP7_9CORY|nr:exonuclease domain-containing protein [Corynebacterium halotolerans]AGF72852.1 DNA polymerase III epsilon subunit [Corynebacterium halotolerans YIM 70093 = DSM 44683]
MIPAHGAQLSVTESNIRIQRSGLSAALLGEAEPGKTGAHDVEIPLTEVTGVDTRSPTALDAGWVHLAGTGVRVPFAPNQAGPAGDFAADVEAALRGEAPRAEGAIPGLNFVGFDVETANSDWGSVCQLGVVRIVDGVEVAAESWLCAPPPGIDSFHPGNVAVHGITAEDVAGQPTFADRLPQLLDFIGDLPFVAHNAQFDATALHRACRASGAAAPELLFACSLTLARGENLGLANHRLPTVAAAFNVPLDNHHDATEDARAAALITVELARSLRHRGSLMELFHSRSVTLGTIDAERVYPVLRDRSGAGVALQARRLVARPGTGAAGADAAAPETGTGADATPDPWAGTGPPTDAPTGQEAAPASSSRGGGRGGGGGNRGPAPWQSVATPDVIPDPNPDADPEGVLFGQNVTLSGDFEPFDKGQLWAGIAERGATVGKNVTKKTTILVAGTWATKTSKQKRAEELIAKGQDIRIWDSARLYEVLDLDPAAAAVDDGFDDEPPF